jgi:hypothetical protein
MGSSWPTCQLSFRDYNGLHERWLLFFAPGPPLSSSLTRIVSTSRVEEGIDGTTRQCHGDADETKREIIVLVLPSLVSDVLLRLMLVLKQKQIETLAADTINRCSREGWFGL